MRISYQWLGEYVSVPDSPEETSELLTMAGLEVEGLEVHRPSLDGVIVGRVEAVRPHPNADRLTLCQVDLGGSESVQIVCGAPNVAAGQLVPVATVGTQLQLPGRDDPSRRQSVTIQRAKLMGETSEGMICAADELGVSGDHSGIMVLGVNAHPGEPLADYLTRSESQYTDVVLDLAVTPNRPDASSHIGVARDLSALQRTSLRIPEVRVPAAGSEAAEQIRVAIEVPERCGRYVAMIVRGIRVSDSPAWLQARLRAIGLRPRNNVVDVTNYVMYECGQPLHAFDYEKVGGMTIRVRLSVPREHFTTLDGKQRELPSETLMICDADRPVAIAGIMGGENSEVTEGTTDVLLESAYFEPAGIRRSARALSMQTDSSYRFERGLDPTIQSWAAARAAALIAELAGGTVVPGLVDENPVPYVRREVALRLSRIRQVLGLEVPGTTVDQLLRSIGFEVTEHGADTFRCVVPPFRPDVEREVDVIEEVARLFGYDNIPEPAQTRVPVVVPHERPADIARRASRLVLEGTGYQEVVTNSMLRSDRAWRFQDPDLSWLRGEVVETLNPISREMSALRPSLLPGVLEAMQHNRNRGWQRMRFFEFGHVFGRVAEGGTVLPGYAEEESLLVVGMGPRHEPGLYGEAESYDFFDIRGVVEELLLRLRLSDVRFEPQNGTTTVSSYHAALWRSGTCLGTLARLRDEVAAEYDLDSGVYFAELAWDRLVAASSLHVPAQYRGIARFPVVDRDLAFVVAGSQEVGEILSAIEEEGGPLLARVSVFDVYEGKGIVEGRKSVAFRLRFAADRTLTDEEVDGQIEAVVARVGRDFGADLRA